MKLNFLFLDESKSPQTSINSLTGLLIPLDRYGELRLQFYEMLSWAIRPEANVLAWPPELHANRFLPDHEDDKKIEMFEKIVSLVLSNKLTVYRIGYYVTKNLKKIFIGDEDLFGLCWFGMVAMLQPKFENEMLIPIMDGFNTDTVRKFSHLIKNFDVYRGAGFSEANLSVKNTQNIIGEVFYADSQYSIFTQVADNISYLRQVADWEREGLEMTEFKKSLLLIANKIAPSLIREEIIPMNGERPKRPNR